MITRREYALIAWSIRLTADNHRGREGEIALGELVEFLCTRLHLENPRFDVAKFVEKCGVSVPPKPTKCVHCEEVIDWDGNGGHIYPDGQTLCADCEE